MNCLLCGGKLEDKPTTFMVDLNHCIVIVKKVPSQVCSQCGEVSYSNGVAKQLEGIVGTIQANALTEIAVVSYAEKIA